MAKWGEDVRNKDYGYFCRAAIDMYNGTASQKTPYERLTVKVSSPGINFYSRASKCTYFSVWDKPVWIISDVRRKTDVKWFVENFGDACRTVRIVCLEEVRRKRGWIYTPGNVTVILTSRSNLFGQFSLSS